jgi:hypothetical protein
MPYFHLLNALQPNVANITSYNTQPNTQNIRCDEVFPNYLANQNANNSNLTQANSLAKAYATQCGIPWTNVVGN